MDHNRHLKTVAEKQEEKEEVRKGCLPRQDQTGKDFEYDDDGYAVAGRGWWMD